MRLRKLFSKKSLMSKISSVAVAIIMVANIVLANVYLPATTKKVEAATINPQYRNVMYYGEWSIYAGQKNFTPNKIPGNYITHLNFAFMDVDENGKVVSCDTWADFENPNVGYSTTSDSVWAGVAPAMIQLRNEYPNMKIGFSVGGWTRSGDFPKVAASSTKRKAFAENIARAAHLYGYDFVDIDWEYPTADRDPDPTGNGVTVDKGCKGSSADTKNFTYLMQDLRDALDKYGAMDNKHYELSVAMSASPSMMEKIEYDKVLNIVDFANMMTYDLNGAWNGYTGHQTALFTNEKYDHENQKDGQFSVNTCVKYLYDKYGNSIDASKIVVGIAPYTRGWAQVQNNGPDPQNPGLYATAAPNSVKAADGTTSGTFAYSDIGSLKSQYGLTEYYDETAQAAYYYSPSSGYFFTCDNPRSVQAKADYVKNTTFKNPFNKPLGGLISWMASLDAASEITKTSHDALFGSGNNLAAQNIEFPAMENMNCTIGTSGSDYTFNIKNNNSVTTSKSDAITHGGAEANVLYYAEKFAGTATYPVYYIRMKDNSKLTGSAWAAGGTVGTSGNYTTVTMTAWPYALDPGETATLTLSGSGNASASNVAEVYMVRRASASGAEFGKTVLYSDGSPSQTQATTKKETTKAQQTQAQQTTKNNATQAQQTQPLQTQGSKGGASYPAWSANSVSYAIGDKVVYNGLVYQCTYAHTSNSAWTPTEAFTLWSATGETGEASGDNGNGSQPTNGSGNQGGDDNNYTVNGTLPQHMVTGYWHNFRNGSADLKLIDVPTYYDMICVAFTGNTNTPGEATFGIDGHLSTALGGYSDADMISDIKAMKARGQHVIISVGGAEGLININSEAAAQKFAQSMIGIIEKYGFEGVDIDLEGGAVSGTQYIASGLRTLHNHFGDDFIITMAPETFYMNPGSGSYWNLAMNIKDILTTVHTQFYNSGSMNGYNGSIANVGDASFPANLSTLYIESGLRPDQVSIGLPSNGSAAGSGQISPEKAVLAYNSMITGGNADGFQVPKAYPTFRGLMTWSINWDATQDYKWAKAASAAVKGTPVIDVSTKKTTTAQQTTKKPDTQTTQSQTQNGENQTTKPVDTSLPQPFGVVANCPRDNVINVVWGNAGAEAYNVYVDGNLKLNSVGCAAYDIEGIAAGPHTVTVKSTANGKESTGTNVDVTVTGSGSVVTTKPATQAQTQAQTQQQTTKAPTQGGSTTGLYSRLLIGYWHTWGSDGNPFIKLRDVNSNWDVINVSFAEPVQPGSTDGKMKFNIAGLSADYTISDFKADVKYLQSQGKKVVLSIGGYEGYFSLTNDAAVNQFVSDIKGFVNEYGFDGIDIDLEQQSAYFDKQGNDGDINNPQSTTIVNTTRAIRTIVESYGDNFILSWAPETYYVQLGYQYYAGINQWCDPRCGDYLPMINALRDITSFVHVQLYNSMDIKAPDGKTYSMGNKEGVVAMCKMLLDGFYVGEGTGVARSEATHFKALRPDQVVIGVPSSQNAAGSGQISNADLQAAFNELDASYPGIRGIMTWSINWDSAQNNNTFAQSNGAFLQAKRAGEELPTQKPTEQTTTKQTTTQATTQPQTQATTKAPQGNGTEVLQNTQFNGADGWNEYTNQGATYTNNGNGSVSVNVPAYNGGDNWSTQLIQSPLTLDRSKYYVATIEVSSNVDKKFQLLMQTTDYNTLDVNETVSVKAGTNSVAKAVFTPSSNNQYLFGVMMGYVDNTASSAANVTIRKVSLKAFDSQQAAQSYYDTIGRTGQEQSTEETTTLVYTTTTKAPETTTKKPDNTTEAQTETYTNHPANVTISDDVEINGYQISYTLGGMRTVYTAKSTINGQNVVEKGLVYGLDSYVDEDQLYLGSGSNYVASFKATDAGKLTPHYSSTMPTETSYAMTMLFSKNTVNEYTTKWLIRVYAKLADGSIVYSKASSYTINNIADKLYQGCKMQNMDGHEYLYNNILKKVNPLYAEVDFNWGGGIVQ